MASRGYISSSGRDPTKYRTALGSGSLGLSWYVLGFCQYFQENPEEIPSNKLALFVAFAIAYPPCPHPFRRCTVEACAVETD